MRIYPDTSKIRSQDIIVTQWSGDVVSDWEKRNGRKTIYMPHAYFPRPVTSQKEYDAVFIGTDSPFRDLSWFEGLPITRVECNPEEVDGYYAAAKICVNIHLGIQKKKLHNAPESILNVPGEALNERTWWICGAGGFQITDNPLIREFFDEDEVALATNKEDFKEVFNYYLEHPEEREEMAKKAHERTMREHLYEHRITKILLPLCV